MPLALVKGGDFKTRKFFNYPESFLYCLYSRSEDTSFVEKSKDWKSSDAFFGMHYLYILDVVICFLITYKFHWDSNLFIFIPILFGFESFELPEMWYPSYRTERKFPFFVAHLERKYKLYERNLIRQGCSWGFLFCARMAIFANISHWSEICYYPVYRN